MKKIRVAINGFGRIGRMTARIMLERSGIELVAFNDLTDTATLAHLFKYDSVHGPFAGTVASDESALVLNGNKVKVLSEKNPEALPWKSLDIDVVIESTGKFVNHAGGEMHLKAGAKKIILSAPAKDKVKTIVIGVNEETIKDEDDIISNASCTTNNVAPMIKLLDDNWGLESTFVTTVHAYTSDQRLHDAPHHDLRRARAAALSIIPTSTGAAKAVAEVLPHLKGKIGGAGIRVPVPNGSVTDITAIVKKETTEEEINVVFKKAAEGSMKNILEYISDPIVSVDIVGNPHSCIFDSLLTSVIGKMVKVVGWYDNEWGYSNRLVDLVEMMVKK